MGQFQRNIQKFVVLSLSVGISAGSFLPVVHATETTEAAKATETTETTETTEVTKTTETTEEKAANKDVGANPESKEPETEKVFYNNQWIELPIQTDVQEIETPVITEENQNILGNQAKAASANSIQSRALTVAGDLTKPGFDFIDVASYQGELTRNDYENMKRYGVSGVVVKLTEGTTYKNPAARAQINGAKAAGLKVSAYHYSWFTSKEQAEKEADFFAETAREMGLDKDTILVNDAENPVMNNGQATSNSIYFALRLINKQGFNSVIHYSYTNWFLTGVLNQAALGYKSTWVANYPNSPTKNNLLHRESAGWQWTSEVIFPGIDGKRFDTNVDYCGYFINKNITPPVIQEEPTGKLKIEDINNKNTTIRLTYVPEKGMNNVKTVKFPVWSQKNGQKDIVWYEGKLQLDGSWTVDVPVSQFKQTGTYNVHMYVYSYTSDGKLSGTGSFEISPAPVPEIKADKKEATNGEFRLSVKVKNAKSDVKQVRVAGWSTANQGNIHWYMARKEGDSWIVDFDVLNHQHISGDYSIHVYADLENGLQAAGLLLPLIKVNQKQAVDTGIDLHRLYNPNDGDHLYTSSTSEKDKLVPLGWRYEGIAWKAAKSGTSIYRVYNPNNGDHHYTTSVNEKNSLVKVGWRDEGVSWYADSNGKNAVYRVYNPNTKKAGSHHYTTNEKEKNNLVKLGWRDEGIAWKSN